jgi:hypothetical protein
MLKDHTLAPAPALLKSDPLEGLSDREMLDLRARIDSKLKIDLARMNLGEELGLQYRNGMELMVSVQSDNGTPANQKAQVFNSVSKMLSDIIKQQKVVFSAERLKRFEAAFHKVLSRMPATEARVYFDLYGEFLRESPEALEALEAIEPGITGEKK